MEGQPGSLDVDVWGVKKVNYTFADLKAWLENGGVLESEDEESEKHKVLKKGKGKGKALEKRKEKDLDLEKRKEKEKEKKKEKEKGYKRGESSKRAK